MLNHKLFCCLGLSAIAILGARTPAFSLEADAIQQPFEVRIVPPAPPEAQGSCFANLPDNIEQLAQKLRKDQQLSEEEIKHLTSLQSKRVELYYYRNADNMVYLLSKLPLGEGCVTTLPLNSFEAGQGVGRGGGNVMSLYGTEAYINHAQRFITSLDLPLPGINLQLWGVQISSNNPEKLAESTSRVRSRISTTQELLRRTFNKIQGLSQLTLQGDTVDEEFRNIANDLGYEDALDGFGGESSILEVFLVGDSLLEGERVKFYNDLYNRIFPSSTNVNNQSQDFSPVVSYLDTLRNDLDRPPFERTFRSRGLKPVPDCENKEKPPKDDENNEFKCKKWRWEEDVVEDLDGNEVSLVNITANFERKVILEFALHYTDFLENPQDFDPEELQRTADNLNELLQRGSDLLQKDIEDLFLKPTLTLIQEEVGQNKGVEFAQVGRSTISTLNGVETQISTSSISGFQISQSQNLGQLLTRAEELQGQISNFLPTGALGDASEAAETAATGGIPTSRLLGLAIASLERGATPLEIKTGTSLAFTPGIARNLNSAELNINLTVTDPTITPTAESNNVPPISRIGKQELNTTVYTEALDFFDLSTFTNQATLDGGRTPIPIIGDIWGAIFGAVPVFGDLFSFSNGNQNVLHESLILTNSFITPTPLSLGNLYSPINGHKFDFCQERNDLLEYLQTLKYSGKASPRNTEIITKRCLQSR